jgi:hypothetical protein
MRCRKGPPPVGGPGQWPPLPSHPKVATSRAPTPTHTEVEGSYTLTLTVPDLQWVEAVVVSEDCVGEVLVANEPCDIRADAHAATPQHMTVIRARRMLIDIDTDEYRTSSCSWLTGSGLRYCSTPTTKPPYRQWCATGGPVVSRGSPRQRPSDEGRPPYPGPQRGDHGWLLGKAVRSPLRR